MPLTSSELSRLRTLSGMISQAKQKLLRLEDEHNRTAKSLNGYISEFSRIESKR